MAALIVGGAASVPVAFAQPAFAAHAYTWSVTCSGTGACTVTWNWTQNGTVIANPPSGSTRYNDSFNFVGPGAITLSSTSISTLQYVQPDTANGITATLQACAGTQCDTRTSAQSFAPGSSVSVSLSASAKANSTSNCFPGYPCHGSSIKIEEAAAFSLNS